MSRPTSEADIVFNRANVALAKSQRLIASWLPPPTPDELARARSEEDLEREDRDTFAPVPQQLGLGAPLPKEFVEGDSNRRELSSNDKLRRKLLGKRSLNPQLKPGGLQNSVGAHRPVTKAANTDPVRRDDDDDDDDDDEEAGRSSLGKSKRRKVETDLGGTEEPDDIARSGKIALDGFAAHDKKLSKPTNYLDQLLAEKSSKKKKKHKKNKAPEVSAVS
ncbi:MAG: hypothetical protein M1819_006438 [Sarea resinae]|nr:MAG: hypothetical protein M1819_006438 [Sarea resinae]